MEKHDFQAEYLRHPSDAHKADPRIASFVTYDGAIGQHRPLTLEDHYGAVCDLTTHPGVPEHVKIQFETAKNLYLYAWHVYRFFAVAEHQALTCLELALRERFGEDL